MRHDVICEVVRNRREQGLVMEKVAIGCDQRLRGSLEAGAIDDTSAGTFLQDLCKQFLKADQAGWCARAEILDKARANLALHRTASAFEEINR